MTAREVCTGAVPEVLLSADIRPRAAAWRPARSLDALRDQINDIAPNRSKLSDGSIGDPAHCGSGTSQSSDHCPRDIPGLGSAVVTARDITHDPAGGADMRDIAEAMRLSRDRRIKYVIFNRRIFSATNDPWTWRPYDGDNPHDRHMHVSVVPTSVADDTSPWEIVMPLTDADVKRIADATAVRVLGKSWAIPGRTLVGTSEAILHYAQVGAGAAAATDKLAGVAQEILKASHNDSESPAVIPEEVRVELAQRTVAGVLEGLGTLSPSDAAVALEAAFGDRLPQLIEELQRRAASG